MTNQTEDQSYNFHNNAAALIIAAAERSGLLRDVANALRASDERPPGMGCLACRALERLTEHFESDEFIGWLGDQGPDYPDYLDEQLRSYLRVPFALPLTTEEVTARMLVLKDHYSASITAEGVPSESTE